MDIDAWRREDPEFTRAVTQIHEPGALPTDPGIPARHAYWELLPGTYGPGCWRRPAGA